MKRIIFNSKKLYIANLFVSSIFFLITVFSLYSFIMQADNKGIEVLLYTCYFITYAGALTILLLKTKKAVITLNVIYFFAIVLNVVDFCIHYSKYTDVSSQYFLLLSLPLLQDYFYY
ncbi:ABC-type multidrug transport system permease subunit [Chryseobacterium sp. SORGH_AS 447]|nr:ABC-type multidrug transport system permease subunit [Chryseobacterium sp. SORGH_AS_0447]